MERGAGEKSALAEVAAEFGVRTFAIVTIDEVVQHLEGREIDGRLPIDSETLERIREYRSTYGAAG